MANVIEFTKAGGSWEYEFVSSGPVAVQVCAASAGRVMVYAWWGDMPRALVAEVGNPYGAVFFGIDVPAGAKVCVLSSTEVTQAAMGDAVG